MSRPERANWLAHLPTVRGDQTAELMILCGNFVILICYWCVKQLAEWLVVIREGLVGCEVGCRELVVGVFYMVRGGCCGRCMLLVPGREDVSLLPRRMFAVGVAGLLEVLVAVGGVGGPAWASGPPWLDCP